MRQRASMTSALASLQAGRSDAAVAEIHRAYDVAAYWHRGQLRRNGQPYITHPVAVAHIVAGAGMDTRLICAALLHDVVEDTPYTLDQLRLEFGDEMVELIADLGGDHLEGKPAEVVVLRLADRLHNLRTLRRLGQEIKIAKSRETLEIHAPLARRIGLEVLGRDLERTAVEVLHRATGGGSRSLPQRLVASVASLLPIEVRERWREEWLAEVAAIQGRQGRLRFALQVIGGLPRMALTLRRSPETDRRGGISSALAWLAAGGAAVLLRSTAAIWMAGAVALASLLLVAVAIFSRSETAVRRLLELIRAVRDRGP